MTHLFHIENSFISRGTLLSFISILGHYLFLMPPTSAREISYNRDIQPILSENCFFCHGPDSSSRKPKSDPLRLDLEEFALAERKDSPATIVPGHPEKSYMIELMESDDPDEVMPLHPSRDPVHGKTVSQEDINLVKEWIRQGAEYEPHWAYLPPQKAALPLPKSSWAKNPIDHFVQAKHQELELKPAPQQEKSRLLRRLTLDLTGITPTTKEVSAWLNDNRDFETIYRKKVDDLLKTPAHAEHMTRLWLDMVRYADTQGIHHDHHRTIWLYRDWVIQAFRENMPFDQFSTEQIAGDLIPDATDSQKIATGYLRCLPTSGEGGLIREEYAAIYAQDRVDNLAATWLGLTTGCASCHDHKFDQISTKEFYQLTAFFRNSTIDAHEGDDSKNGPILYTGPKDLGVRLPIARSEHRELKIELRKQKDKKNSKAKELKSQLEGLSKEIKSILAKGNTTLVYEEKTDSEPYAHILLRGSYSSKGEKVTPNTPAFLPSLKISASGGINKKHIPNRLDLAHWITNSQNPLPSRVTVNRYWSYFFGQGFLKNNEDFGVMGGHPTHPELLDWLSRDFIDSNWDLRHLLKTIVTSATYRQSATVNTQHKENDPKNIYLTRGPRYRLDAEQIRDLALSSSKLLSTKIGGPSVKPYQPPSLWLISMPNSTSRKFTQSQGEDLYRRSLYTYWKRQALHPTMETLNATNREVSCSLRTRTNTPLQSLVLLNDPQFLEAARHLASNALKIDTDLHKVLDHITLSVLSRKFNQTEKSVALHNHKTLLEHYKSNSDLTKELLSIGESTPSESNNNASLAAWTMVASQILNLDEALTK